MQDRVLCPAITTSITVAALAACLACGPAAEDEGSARAADPRPNVVVIVADDAGYTDFGAFGDPEMPTPRIDSIADNGVRFTQGYNAASVCSPSRAGLLTGRYPQRFGHEFNISRGPQRGLGPDEVGLPLSERTIADALRDLGYATAAVGKWHLGVAPPFHPLNRGFDEFFGFLHGSRSYSPLEDVSERGLQLLHNDQPMPEQGYLTDVLAAQATDLIEVRRAEPFFLYVAFNAVHTPMHAKPEQEALFAGISDERRRTLAAMTVALDEGVGAILDTLRDLDLEDNTLLFFVNDNGGATNNASSNAPLRGQKGDKFEGGIRVPFMAQWPARLPRGADYDHPVSSMDIFPTAVAAASTAASDSTDAPPRDAGAGAATIVEALDGVDLLPYLAGAAGADGGRPHETLFWRRGIVAAVRRVSTEGDHKLIRSDSEPTWLFDLAADPYETTNLLDEEPEHAVALLAALERWEADLAEPLWREAPMWSESQIEKHAPSLALPPMVQQRPGYTPTAAGAPSTDIYLATLTRDDGMHSVGSPRNITDRDGYDNQPAFEAGGTTLLYTSARNRTQTDIYRHDLEAGTTRQVTQTLASEYSATPLPSGDGFSSIHESADGQLLWRYDNDGTSRGGILPDVQPVGYHAWGDDNRLIMFVLGGGGNPATLQLGDLRNGTAEVIAESPGRSLHKVPGRHALSFVRKLSRDEWWMELLDLDTMEYTRLGQTLPGREDYAWTTDGALIMGDGSKLFQMRPGEEWVEIADVEGAGVSGISRLAINESGTRIAIVGERGREE
jgi:arylsulfatase A-like enzyme